MQFGMNLLLWTDHLHDGMLPVLEQLKKIGYDGVEVPIFNPDEKLHREWGKHLDNLGLRRTAVTIRTEADNPISPDAKIRAAGIDATKRTLDCCQAIGAESLCGPTTQRSVCSAARGQPKTNGNGASKACGKSPSMPGQSA